MPVDDPNLPCATSDVARRRRNEGTTWSRAVVPSLLLFAIVACTAVVSEDAVQCTTDRDCTARGPDFVDTVCGPSGLCTPRGAPAPECAKNSDCASRGPDQVCSSLSHKCAPVTSEDCSVAYGNPLAEGAVLFGLLSDNGRDDGLYF